VNPDTVKTYRIPGPDTPAGGFENSTWIEFTDEFAEAFSAPMINDTFKRYYWAGPSTPALYNTLTRIQAGNAGANAPFLLGVPTPVSTPSLGISGGLTTNQVTRSYVYTFVSAYGEEGAPSPPVVATDSANNTWTLSWTAPTGAITTGRNLTHINIYRTIANGQGGADFFFVAQVTIATTSYADTTLDTAISGHNLLQSAGWTPPPSLQGIAVMPNGMVAGWANDREIWFCEPYRPHAWPSTYTVSVDYPIVGIAAMGQSLVVATQGNPYIITGMHPSVMSISKIPAHEPCLARHSIAAGPDGIYYASWNGLMLINPNTASIVTASLFTRQDWAALGPTLFQGSMFGQAYISFVKKGSLIGGETYDGSVAYGTPIDGLGGGTPVYDGIHAQWVAASDQGDNGFIIDGSNPNTAFTRISVNATVLNTYQDEYTGELMGLVVNATTSTGFYAGPIVYQFDSPLTTSRLPYIWRSKKFQVPYKQSLVAAKVFFEVTPEASSVVTGARNTSLYQDFDPSTQLALFRVYADGALVLTRELQASGEIVQLPSGFKADYWQFEINGQVAVKNIQVATSVKELQSI
jgi:hypothetical protein